MKCVVRREIYGCRYFCKAVVLGYAPSSGMNWDREVDGCVRRKGIGRNAE